MTKPLAGKRFFESLGRSAASRGYPMNYQRLERRCWPIWARTAWARGWLIQPSPRQQTDRIVQSFEEEAQERGESLRETVNRFLESAK